MRVGGASTWETRGRFQRQNKVVCGTKQVVGRQKGSRGCEPGPRSQNSRLGCAICFRTLSTHGAVRPRLGKEVRWMNSCVEVATLRARALNTSRSQHVGASTL